MGNEMILYLEEQGKAFLAVLTRARAPTSGQRLTVAFDTANVHLFDADTNSNRCCMITKYHS